MWTRITPNTDTFLRSVQKTIDICYGTGTINTKKFIRCKYLKKFRCHEKKMHRKNKFPFKLKDCRAPRKKLCIAKYAAVKALR